MRTRVYVGRLPEETAISLLSASIASCSWRLSISTQVEYEDFTGWEYLNHSVKCILSIHMKLLQNSGQHILYVIFLCIVWKHMNYILDIYRQVQSLTVLRVDIAKKTGQIV